MIARTVLALLRLDRLIVHVHVVFDRRHILMPQQFLQAKGVIAQHQVANGEGMAEDVGADALAGDTRSLPDALEEQRDPVLGERQARLREEEVVLIGAAPLGQLILIGAVAIQVVQEVAQAVAPQGDATLLGAFAGHGKYPVLAVKV